ncbi:[protein-PII] uridylyltransferase [Thermodesulfobacteriota bacterium]
MPDSALRARRKALETLWQKSLSGRALLRKHSKLIDSHLAGAYEQSPACGSEMTLIALGGYGRSELFPFSDIDLLILYKPGSEHTLEAATESLLYPLWDAGLDVGHSVRTPEACLADAEDDFFFQVALLEARFIAGSEYLFFHLQEQYKNTFIEGHRQAFLDKMMTSHQNRHHHFGTHSYLLEPNIKDCRGGLRDVHSMLWTSQVVFGMKTIADIEVSGLMTELERKTFDDARDNLIRIRNRLHYLSGRKNDQLYFEHQEDIARALGYQEKDGILGVEQFMRGVYSSLHTIASYTDIFFEHADETLTPPSKSEDIMLKPGIILRNRKILLKTTPQVTPRPDQILSLFFLAVKHDCPIHYWTKKYISNHLQLIDDKARKSPSMARIFYALLQGPNDPLRFLRTMLETGLLTAYIPEFSLVESLNQHDVYHIFTVDRHLLQTVSELHSLRDEEPIFLQLPAPHTLFLAALFHDIGKGSGRNHTEAGAETTARIVRRMGLPEREQQLVSFLVLNHLYLPNIAMRRDLEDENFILQCARHIGNIENLRMLYLLSIADARATGPTVWNEWKAALLLELFLKVANALEQEHPGEFSQSQGATWMRSHIAELFASEPPAVLETLPQDYLLDFSPETVMKHILWAEQLRTREVNTHPDTHDTGWTLTVITSDSTGLLAKICGTLALHNLNIIRAKIFTWPNGTVVDVFDIQSTVDISFADQDWENLNEDLTLALQGRLGLPHRLAEKAKLPVYGRKKTGLQHKPKVVIDNKTTPNATVIEVYASDHPRLLYNITRTLADFGISISQARITTAVDQIVDVFYATDHRMKAITDPELLKELHAALLYAADP